MEAQNPPLSPFDLLLNKKEIVKLPSSVFKSRFQGLEGKQQDVVVAAR